VQTTIRCCERALDRSQEVAGVGLADIDHVVLVGGSTRVPLVMKRVREALCEGKSKCTEPMQDEVDTCVALGAAIFAAQTGGVRIGDDAMQILWKSPLVGHAQQLRLSFVAEQAPSKTAEFVIASSSGQELGKVAMGAPGSVLRVSVPLEEREENPTRIEARDSSGQILASLPFALYRGDVRPRASALSQPAVIAKDISVEILRGRRRERKVLIPRGTGLPTTKMCELATGDRSGAVVLRLLQNRLPIKTLVLDVPPELPLGTPVELELSCDDAMRIEARAKVAGRELWARIDAAPRTVVNIDEIDGLLADGERISKHLWGREAQSFRREFEPLANGLRELVSTDPTRLAALASALKELLEEFDSRDAHELSPPFQRFEAVLDALRTTVYSARGPLLGLDRSAWDARVNELHTRAHAAWESADAPEWRRVYSEAQALLETAHTHELGSMRIDDPSYLVRRATGLHAWAMRIERALLDFIPSSTEELRELQLEERDRLLETLRRKITEPLGRLSEGARTPTEVRQRLDAFSSELERIDHAAERLPSIGVVSDRRG
jgi:molecular chaperone DnaK